MCACSIFLYFFLLSCFTAVIYFFFTVWVAPYLPQKRRTAKGEKKSSAKKESTDQGTDGNATASSGTVYNAEWIPAHHINRPEARKVKGSSRSKGRT